MVDGAEGRPVYVGAAQSGDRGVFFFGGDGIPVIADEPADEKGDDGDEIQHEEDDELCEGGHKGEIDLADENEDGEYLEDDGKYLCDDGADAVTDGTFFRFCGRSGGCGFCVFDGCSVGTRDFLFSHDKPPKK